MAPQNEGYYHQLPSSPESVNSASLPDIESKPSAEPIPTAVQPLSPAGQEARDEQPLVDHEAGS